MNISGSEWRAEIVFVKRRRRNRKIFAFALIAIAILVAIWFEFIFVPWCNMPYVDPSGNSWLTESSELPRFLRFPIEGAAAILLGSGLFLLLHDPRPRRHVQGFEVLPPKNH